MSDPTSPREAMLGETAPSETFLSKSESGDASSSPLAADGLAVGDGPRASVAVEDRLDRRRHLRHPRWRPPLLHHQLRSLLPVEEERRVTWLELFYDLVYVAIIIEMGNGLSQDASGWGVVRFVALFVPIWWSWTGVTFYINRFVVDDVVHRALVFAQILPVAVLGLSVSQAFGDLAPQFVFAYAALRVILLLLYARAWRHVPSARPLIWRYMVGFGLALGIWLVSAWVPAPWQWALWALAMGIDIGTPLVPQTRRFNRLIAPDVPHMAERYGLFTLIVLGEGFVKSVTSASGTEFTLAGFVFSCLGLTLTYCLWWLYFDELAGERLTGDRGDTYVWLYTHLPLAIALTAFGVAVAKHFMAVGDDVVSYKYRLLLGGAVATYLAAVGLLTRVVDCPHRVTRRTVQSRLRFGAGACALALTLWLPPVSSTLFVFVTLVCAAVPIVYDLARSYRRHGMFWHGEVPSMPGPPAD